MSEEIIENAPSKVDYNLKGAVTMQIANRMSSASSRYAMNRPELAYKDVKAIRLIINYKLTESEAAGVKEMESLLEEYFFCIANLDNIKSMWPGHNLDELPEYDSNRSKAIVLKILSLKRKVTYESYFERVMELLDKYGFLFGIKEDDTEVGFD